MHNQKRRRWTAEEKLNTIEEARQTSQTISEVCPRQGIAPGQSLALRASARVFAWEKQARSGALVALKAKQGGRKRGNRETELEKSAVKVNTQAGVSVICSQSC